MTIETGIFDLLSNTSAVSTLVSARIYPLRLPQDPTYPAITYRRISGVRINNLLAASGRAHPRFQIDCWGSTITSARAVATAVRQALNCYRGLMDDVTASVHIENEIDLDEDDAKVYRVSQDYFISHTET